MRGRAVKSSRLELAEVGIQANIQNVEWAEWIRGVYINKNYDLSIVCHAEPLDLGIYANPNYYFQYDSQAYRDIYAKVSHGAQRRRPTTRRLAKRRRRSPRTASTPSYSSCRTPLSRTRS